MTSLTPLFEVDDLSIATPGANPQSIVQGACLSLHSGETAALVGRSGSGKTMLARALIGLLPRGVHRTTGRIVLDGRPLDDAALAAARGDDIAFVFQDPLSSLNPALRIADQLRDAAEPAMRSDRAGRMREMLERVQIRDPEHVLRSYPHQLSGGMRQRVMIASALLCSPRLVIADEPTTALDAVVQAEIVGLMASLTRDLGAALLIITHDLSLVAESTDKVHVVDNGAIVEHGPTAQIIARPTHPAARALVDAIPKPPAIRPPVPRAAPLVTVQGLSVLPPRDMFTGKDDRRAILWNVDFTLGQGETLAIIGESGSGKTTLGRVLAGLHPVRDGSVTIADMPVHNAPSAIRRRRQFIHQDALAAFDPTARIADILGEALLPEERQDKHARMASIAAALAMVDLDPAIADRYPHALSGGQRQRLNFARAIAARPELVIADEPVSALDLPTQQRILALLRRLQQELGFACILISHDLNVVEHVADRVGVLYRGVLVEVGPAAAIFERPAHPYTRRLIAAMPLPLLVDEATAPARRDVIAPADPQGYLPDADAMTHPPLDYRQIGPDHFIACIRDKAKAA